jgi:hypothetical protein
VMAKRKSTLPPDYQRLEGMHTLSDGKEIVAGPFMTSAEACKVKETLFPTGQHPESGARVEVNYHPGRKTLRKWDRQDRSLNAFHVTYWQVVEDRKIDRGRLIGAPLSRKFPTRQKCREALARIKGSNPRAYIWRMTYLCHWGCREDIEARKILLDEIRCIPGRHRSGVNRRTEASHV